MNDRVIVLTGQDRTGEKTTDNGQEYVLLPSGIVCWGVRELVWVPVEKADEWKRKRPSVFGEQSNSQSSPKSRFVQRAQEDAGKGPGHEATPEQLGLTAVSSEWLEYKSEYDAAVRRILTIFGQPLPEWIEFGGIWAGKV